MGGLMRHQLATPEQPSRRPRLLQPAVHDARHDDDVPVRRADDAGLRALPRAADGRHAQHRVSAHDRLRLLAVSPRRPAALRSASFPTPAPDAGWFAYVPLAGPAIRHRQARRRLEHARHLQRGDGPDGRGRHHDDDPEDARARHVAAAHAAVRVGVARHVDDDHLRDADGDARREPRAVRPHARHAFLQSRRRRRRAALAAPVLVLRASGGLLHLHPGARIHLGDHPDVRAPADVRTRRDRAVADRHRLPRRSGCGCITCSRPTCPSSARASSRR